MSSGSAPASTAASDADTTDIAETAETADERRRTQADRRRSSQREVLDAAAEVIAEKGSAKASFSDIAAVAGQSRAHPHYLFGSKANLLQALVEDFSSRYTDEVVSRIGDARGLDAIAAVVKMFVRSLRRPLPMTRAFYVLLGESLSAAPELRPGLAAYHQWLKDLIRGWIDEAIEAGEVAATLDADAAATTIVATVRGIGFLVLSDPGSFDLRALETQTLAQIDLRTQAPPA
jgi:AcrR family transcriptional regulator